MHSIQISSIFLEKNEKPNDDWNNFQASDFFFPIRIFVRHRCYLLDCPNEEVATVAVVVVMCF